MTTIVRFRYHQIDGYRCLTSGDMSGEYVPLVEYQEAINLVNELGEKDVQNLLQIDKLQVLIRRVNELESSLRIDAFGQGNFTSQHLKLVKLLKDCQEAVE